LVCGGPGCGKTLLAVEFLVRGAVQFGEPGVFMSFEETDAELKSNVASLGFDLAGLVRRKRIVLDHVHIERSEIRETGEYDLEGLFVRLNLAIDSIGAKRVVLDTLETLFASLPNEAILRAELRRLFRWLKDKGVTAVITAERGRAQLTRHGLEEYVSDCVILLDHRVNDQIATRHLRVVKYRGALHGTNEFPFLIGDEGLSVLPITSLGLNHKVSTERISTGIPRLDAMLGGRGFFRGSSILLTGTPGTGKTSVASFLAKAAAQRGDRVLYFSFEESPNQIIRNMRSIGLRLEPSVKRGRLRFHAARPSLCGLEMHLATMFKEIAAFQPAVVIVDPITSLLAAGTDNETKGMVTRLVDFLKGRQVTSLFTSLTHGDHALQQSEIVISSLMDSWLLLQDFEGNGERNRVLYVLKARGMAHSNQVREFLISNQGIDIADAYIGPSGVLTGASRRAQADREKAEALAGQQEANRRKRELERKRATLEQQITGLRSEHETEEAELRRMDEQVGTQTRVLTAERSELARLRQADTNKVVAPTRGKSKTKSQR
jgi:circadian clock protein KaiC